MRAKKVYLLEIDYASYMLAIVLARHTVDQENLNQQWTRENLRIKVNKLQWGNTANFGVDYVALKHGMIFSSELKRRGVTYVTMFQADKSFIHYFNFEAHHRSTEVKFASYYCPPVEQDTELLDTIREVRDEMLKRATTLLLFTNHLLLPWVNYSLNHTRVSFTWNQQQKV